MCFQPQKRTLSLAITCLLVLAMLGTAQTQKPRKVIHTVNPDLAQAEAAMDKQDFVRAEQLLSRAVAEEPQNDRAWFDLGYVYVSTQRAGKAIEAFKRSLAINTDSFEANFNLARVLADGDKPEDAMQFLEAAGKTSTASANRDKLGAAWFRLGQQLEKKKPSLAIRAYQKSAEFPLAGLNEAEPHLRAAVVFQNAKEFANAESEFKTALTIDPKSAAAISGLTEIYNETNRPTEAQALAHNTLANNPQSPAAHYQIGNSLLQSGKTDEAIAEFEAGLVSYPQEPMLLRALAAAYSAAKRYDEAIVRYRSLLAALPNDADLHFALGTAYMANHNCAAAEDELISSLKLDPRNVTAYGNLAVCAAQQKHYELAIKVLDARAKLAPESMATYFLRATSYDNLKMYRPAVENYKEFLKAYDGKLPDQEWQARHRLIAIEPMAGKK